MRIEHPERTVGQVPELESASGRLPALGYERPEDVGLVQCLGHGYPTPLARWHYHEECELHLIVATAGKAFVGDWIGPFQPGHLVLCGPRLPHNWISDDIPEEGVALRDLVIQFRYEPIAQAALHIPELAEVVPMLDRARFGIEFFGLAPIAEELWHRCKKTRGIERFAAFCEFLSQLAACKDYRLLSSSVLQGDPTANGEDERINIVVDRITSRLSEPVAQSDLARDFGMTQSQFSRWFRRATGNTYVDFVNRVRINHACQLLAGSDRLIASVCQEVGFNNVANFNRRFLELEGITPSEFRRRTQARARPLSK